MLRALAYLFLATLAANALAEKIVRIGVSSLPVAQGTPYTATNMPVSIPAAAIFDSLTVVNNQGELEPWLATSWHAEDELTWVISLRGDIEFSNGEPFDADAVIAALEYTRSPEGLRFAIARELSGVISARTRDPLTVELRTSEPDAMLPRSLAGLRIAAPGHFRKLGANAFRLDPVGTGPFKVVSWESGRVRMVANIDSWRPPKVDALELLLIPEQSARLQALQSGAIDVAIGLGPDDQEALAQVDARVHRELTARVLTLAFVTVRESPLTDPRVRLALNHAVNRQLIVDTVLAGATEPATQAAPNRAFGYDPGLTALPYDPDRARALLREAGYPDGFDMLATVTIGNAAADQQIYQPIAADLGRVGVDLELQRIPLGTLVRYFYEGNWPGLAFSMDYSTEPSLDALRPFLFHSCLWSEPFHCDEEVVPLIVAARHEFDLDKRRELVRRVLRHHHRAPPGILLWQLPRFDGLTARIQNYRTIPGGLMLHEIELTDRP